MRIIITASIIFFNFILQTTLFPLCAIRGIFPNTALILATSYALLRGSREGAIFGGAAGLLMDIFFNTSIFFYTALFAAISYLFGRGQRDFYRENYFLPVFFCAVSTCIYEGALYLPGFLLRGEGSLLFLLFRVLLPEIVYTAVLTVPIYRALFGINEWLELKEKYKYRLF